MVTALATSGIANWLVSCLATFFFEKKKTVLTSSLLERQLQSDLFLVVMNLWLVHMAQVNSSCNLYYNITIHLWPHANSFYMKYLKILDGCNSGWEEWRNHKAPFFV